MHFVFGILILSCCAFSLSSSLLGDQGELVQRQTTSKTFSNPVIYEDFADNDVFLGLDGKYYFSASNMHYSPGAPILRSSDLINWEFIGHSVPSLSWDAAYNMTAGTAYRRGTWASTMRYRQSNGLWYWIGCIDFWVTYVYTASAVTGPWTQGAAFYGKCYYDCGLHIDDDDTMYVVYGNADIFMAQLSSDGFSEVKSQQIFSTPSGYSGVEGNRLYNYNGTYYVLDDSPSSGATFIWKSSSPWGPWTSKLFIEHIASPIPGSGSPIQGSLVETPGGDWYFMSFVTAYPSGRTPILAPITWGSDGFPVLTTVDGAWGSSYPYPLPMVPTPSWTGTDTFQGTSLGVQWEWNHNPDPTKFIVNDGLNLSTATVTTDLFTAQNTLTRRLHGPLPVGTVSINFTNMADGDRAGLAAFRDQSSYISIHRSGDTYTIEFVDGMLQNSSDWSTISNGTVLATENVSSTRQVMLRANIDARPDGAKQATFFYSTDGAVFTQLGGAATLNTDWRYFMGYRFAIFNFATKQLGGSVTASSFTSA